MHKKKKEKSLCKNIPSSSVNAASELMNARQPGNEQANEGMFMEWSAIHQLKGMSSWNKQPCAWT